MTCEPIGVNGDGLDREWDAIRPFPVGDLRSLGADIVAAIRRLDSSGKGVGLAVDWAAAVALTGQIAIALNQPGNVGIGAAMARMIRVRIIEAIETRGELGLANLLRRAAVRPEACDPPCADSRCVGCFYGGSPRPAWSGLVWVCPGCGMSTPLIMEPCCTCGKSPRVDINRMAAGMSTTICMECCGCTCGYGLEAKKKDTPNVT